ncbi:uncharacterized protein LOC129583958 [Paramacrobiotus metropolitanus]|uniref:uncharacterized protein LOC129583958 n=1 Tax=Paramacrobiotus metropolitanus TaxID=2943436 RepID=UPI002445ECF2|nr:uncharacterized protein LOC129583958 [Paramacrobiotus metropolitanus]
MDASGLLFLILDPTLVVREEDDPLRSILYYYPPTPTTPVDAQCAWSSQLIGVFTFWKQSLKSQLRYVRIDGYTLAFEEYSSRFLFILGWKMDDAMAQSVIVTALEEHLRFLVRAFCFYVEMPRSLAENEVNVYSIVLESILKICSLRCSDLSLFRDFSAVFKEASHIKMTGQLCLNKCHSGQGLHSAKILAALLIYRADVIAKEIPEFLPGYNLLMLVGALMDDSASRLPGSDLSVDANGIYLQCSVFSVNMPVEQYEMFVLDYNLRRAVRSIKSHQNAKTEAPLNHANKYDVQRELRDLGGKYGGDRIRLSLLVLRLYDTKLVLLVEDAENHSHNAFVTYVLQKTLPFLEILNAAAVDYLFSQSERVTRDMRAKNLQDRKVFTFDLSYRHFLSLPDDEEELLTVFEGLMRFFQETGTEGRHRLSFTNHDLYCTVHGSEGEKFVQFELDRTRR